jgi:hypothetical protein
VQTNTSPLPTAESSNIAHTRPTLRTELANQYDSRLSGFARREARYRRAFGLLSRTLLARQHYHKLGFARLNDYTRERLGLSAREIQTAAAVSDALDGLPRTLRLFQSGQMNWTTLRVIASVATAETELRWLQLAAGRSASDLQALVRKHRDDKDPGGDRDELGSALDDSNTIDGEPAVEFRLACPPRVRSLWRKLLLLARRGAGSDISSWQAAEVIAAEALSGADVERMASSPERPSALEPSGSYRGKASESQSVVSNRDKPETSALAGKSDSRPSPSFGELVAANELRRTSSALPDLDDSSALEQLPLDAAKLNAHDIDARLREVLASMQRIDSDLGRLLRRFLQLDLYRELGFASSADYIRERLGISVRKARSLVSVERNSDRCGGELGQAYRQGRLSWLQALMLLRIITEDTAHIWVRRAQAVTLRRLADEVEWALDRRDSSPRHYNVSPPALGADLESGQSQPEVQIGSRPAHTRDDISHERIPLGEFGSVHVRLRAPASVVMLMEEAISAFARPQEPRWRAFERMLIHDQEHWQSQPRHRDPVFARDGWRCAVPACSSRRNLHDHHIIYRSRQGGNQRENRVSLCYWHHQVGVHGTGVVKVTGTVGKGLFWELGARREQAPLLSLVGDVYAHTHARERVPQVGEPHLHTEHGKEVSVRLCAAIQPHGRISPVTAV